MNVASLELCKELYELSGWRDTPAYCYLDTNGRDIHFQYTGPSGNWWYEGISAFPAYSLGYMLRKLPNNITGKGRRWSFRLHKLGDNTYTADYWRRRDGSETPWFGRMRCGGDTPEDATCKLAIELFKQGILA